MQAAKLPPASVPNQYVVARDAGKFAPRANALPATQSVDFRAASMDLTETVFVVFQTTDEGVVVPVTYRVQVWRLTVLPPAQDLSSNRTPRKET